MHARTYSATRAPTHTVDHPPVHHSKKKANHSYCGAGATWGCGACGDAERGIGPGCHVAAWSTEDLVSWADPVKVITLPLNQTVPNVGASMVPSTATPPPNVPKHQAFMALENSKFATAINVGNDRDLSKNWVLRPVNSSSDACRRGHCTPGLACPSTRYNPLDQFYYVFGGGNDIQITRSKDLVTWETRNMSLMTHCKFWHRMVNVWSYVSFHLGVPVHVDCDNQMTCTHVYVHTCPPNNHLCMSKSCSRFSSLYFIFLFFYCAAFIHNIYIYIYMFISKRHC